jgi:hypothetical protein
MVKRCFLDLFFLLQKNPDEIKLTIRDCRMLSEIYNVIYCIYWRILEAKFTSLFWQWYIGLYPT